MAKAKKKICFYGVGVDISAKSFHGCFSYEDEERVIKVKANRKFRNTEKGIENFIEWIEERRTVEVPLFIAMEATGVYYELLAYRLKEQGYSLSVQLPNKVCTYKKSMNIKSKTDREDAIAIARMCLERRLKEWEPMSDQMYGLKKNCRERSALIKTRTQLKNQLHAEKCCAKTDEEKTRRISELIEVINNQLKEIDKTVKKKVDSDPGLKERVGKIMAVKGLGMVTIVNTIAELNGFALIDNEKQLMSFVGMDIVERQSGTSVKGETRISKKGNSRVRSGLYMAAMSASKHNAECKNLYKRIKGRTKISMKANVAVQRKLLSLIYTLFKKNEKYDPNYWKNQGKKDKKLCKSISPKPLAA